MDISKYTNKKQFRLNQMDTKRLLDLNSALNVKKLNIKSIKLNDSYVNIIESIEAEINEIEQKHDIICKEHHLESVRLRKLFWEDAFTELDLHSANDDVKKLLKAKAERKTHLSEIFSELKELSMIYHLC